MLKKYEFDGLEGFGYKDFFKLYNALDKEGLSMPVNCLALNFEADGKLKGTSKNRFLPD